MGRRIGGTSKGNTAAQHSFATVPRVQTQRSAFNRNHGLKTTLGKSGFLYPFFLDEVLPGDTMTMNATLFGRIATLLNPVMDSIFMDTHFFAVPMRLLWENFQKFMGEQEDPGDTVDFIIPEIDRATITDQASREGQLWDHFGLPSKWDITDVEAHVSALPWRAYNLIWNEWFRDQNLQNSVTINRDNGPDDFADYTLMRRGKRHDYFTSCLPWPQKGPAVTLPLGTVAPVRATAPTLALQFDHGSVTNDEARISGTGGHLNRTIYSETAPTLDDEPLRWPTNTIALNLETDLSSATAATINAIRQAFQIQRLYERDARGGTRYTEIIRSHFGVVSDDARLQRPEYLGGGSSPLSVNPVAQTVGNAPPGDYQIGELGAFGTMVQQTPSWTKSFTEHCYVIGLVSVRADLTYQEGQHKLWTRRTKHDFFWPALAHLGEQAVLNSEINVQGDAADHNVWGYQERYAEYRYKPSTVTAGMRSENASSYDIWHLAQDFAAVRPNLNDTFIQENPPVGRVIANFAEEHFLLDVFFKYTSVRPMPTYSIPGLIDHF